MFDLEGHLRTYLDDRRKVLVMLEVLEAEEPLERPAQEGHLQDAVHELDAALDAPHAVGRCVRPDDVVVLPEDDRGVRDGWVK